MTYDTMKPEIDKHVAKIKEIEGLDGSNNPNGGDIFLGFEPFTSIEVKL